MRLSTLVGATCFYVILFGMILNLAPSFWRHILVWFYNPVTLIVVYIGKYAYQDHALEVAVSKEWFTVGKTPLHTAAKVGTAKVCKKMIDDGADVNVPDKYGETPLHVAASSGNVDTCMLLVEAGADIFAKQEYGSIPLHCAASAGHPKVCAFLLVAGTDDVNAKSAPSELYFHDETALHNAASSGHTETCKFLLEMGADLQSKTSTGETPLHRATVTGYREGGYEVCKFLIGAGADVHAEDNEGNTPLHRAAPYPESCKALLEAKADLHARNSGGGTPLHKACTYSGIRGAKYLVEEANANLNAQDKHGRTPLHWACETLYSKETTSYLVESKADLHVKDVKGWTPLHVAAFYRRTNSCRILLEAGASGMVRNKNGKTPFRLISGKSDPWGEYGAILKILADSSQSVFR